MERWALTEAQAAEEEEEEQTRSGRPAGYRLYMNQANTRERKMFHPTRLPPPAGWVLATGAARAPASPAAPPAAAEQPVRIRKG